MTGKPTRLDKKALANAVAERLGISPHDAEAAVDATLDEIYNAVAQGRSVSLRNFGTFYVEPKRSNWVFKFNPSQKWRKCFGWSSTYKGDL